MNLEKIASKSLPSVYLSHVNVGTGERIVSLVGGVVLAAYGIRRSSAAGYGVAAAGAALIFRGLTGFCPVNAAIGRDSSELNRSHRHVDIRTSLTVDKQRDEVYAYWRKLENLPRFMKHLEEVREVSARRSEWAATVPKIDARIEWKAEIQAEEENSRLAWRSVEGSEIENAGEVRFDDAPAGRGTVLHVHISYKPPAGELGRVAAALFNPGFEQLIKEDIRRFKHVIETGEVPSTSGQPSGRE